LHRINIEFSEMSIQIIIQCETFRCRITLHFYLNIERGIVQEGTSIDLQFSHLNSFSLFIDRSREMLLVHSWDTQEVGARTPSFIVVVRLSSWRVRRAGWLSSLMKYTLATINKTVSLRIGFRTCFAGATIEKLLSFSLHSDFISINCRSQSFILKPSIYEKYRRKCWETQLIFLRIYLLI